MWMMGVCASRVDYVHVGICGVHDNAFSLHLHTHTTHIHTDRRRAVAAAQAEEDADPSMLIITGKRRRARVDYAQLAAEMLVDGLLTEDQEDQEDWAPTPR